VLLRWLAVVVGVLGWLLIVPLIELWKALVRRLKGS
jgi:hypothetical protein